MDGGPLFIDLLRALFLSETTLWRQRCDPLKGRYNKFFKRIHAASLHTSKSLLYVSRPEKQAEE